VNNRHDKKVPKFMEPKFVKIIKYERFSINKFKEIIEKVLIKMNKMIET
jgi:hypothetical protein